MKKASLIILAIVLICWAIFDLNKPVRIQKDKNARVAKTIVEPSYVEVDDCGSLLALTCPPIDTADQMATHMEDLQMKNPGQLIAYWDEIRDESALRSFARKIAPSLFYNPLTFNAKPIITKYAFNSEKVIKSVAVAEEKEIAKRPVASNDAGEKKKHTRKSQTDSAAVADNSPDQKKKSKDELKANCDGALAALQAKEADLQQRDVSIADLSEKYSNLVRQNEGLAKEKNDLSAERGKLLQKNAELEKNKITQTSLAMNDVRAIIEHESRAVPVAFLNPDNQNEKLLQLNAYGTKLPKDIKNGDNVKIVVKNYEKYK